MSQEVGGSRFSAEQQSAFQRNGYLIGPECLSVEIVTQMQVTLKNSLSSTENNSVDAESVRKREGAVYAARNVLELCPAICEWIQLPQVQQLLQTLMSGRAYLVRGLYFDKPQGQNWALPWHKDLLIAVDDQSQQRKGYSPLRPRAGVLHTEPPLEVLESILTLRIHLDEVTSENGPLQVLPGSHRSGKRFCVDDFQPEVIETAVGGILAMSPLLAHCSHQANHDRHTNRRILHLEFSSLEQPCEGVKWKWAF